MQIFKVACAKSSPVHYLWSEVDSAYTPIVRFERKGTGPQYSEVAQR